MKKPFLEIISLLARESVSISEQRVFYFEKKKLAVIEKFLREADVAFETDDDSIEVSAEEISSDSFVFTSEEQFFPRLSDVISDTKTQLFILGE